jgi:hypothetical protein
MKVTVYKVKIYNYLTDEFVIFRRMATRSGAAAMRGVVLEETGIDVDSSQLEPGEDWTPKDYKP